MEMPPQRLVYVEQTRRSLLDAAENHFISIGYRATSLDAVAETARFTKGALYRHFANKEAVFAAVLERVQYEAVEQIALAPAGPALEWPDAMAAVAAYLDVTASERFRRIVLEEAPGVLGWARWRALDEQTTGGIVRQMVERFAEAGVIKPVDTAVTSRLICAVVAEAVLGLAAADEPRAARQTALACVEQLLSGLRT